eukprot:910843-Rhodomonas_salina.1
MSLQHTIYDRLLYVGICTTPGGSYRPQSSLPAHLVPEYRTSVPHSFTIAQYRTQRLVPEHSTSVLHAYAVAQYCTPPLSTSDLTIPRLSTAQQYRTLKLYLSTRLRISVPDTA